MLENGTYVGGDELRRRRRIPHRRRDRLDAFLVKVPGELLVAAPQEPPPAQLSVTAIQPNVVAQAIGTATFVVTGSGFAPGISLVFEGGSGPAPSVLRVTRDSAAQISAVVEIRSGGPRRERRGDVRVTNPDGSSSVGADLLRITP